MLRFSRDELRARGRRGDALLVIDNEVYDVGGFPEEHPGGAQVLLANAGEDASQCFRDVGHSDDALRRRARLRVGEVAPAERWPEPRAPPEPAPEPEPAGGARAALALWAPPLLLAALAVALHVLLF